MCKTCNLLDTPFQPSSAATKCQSSTAENSPKRSWISRSDSSRKIQLVVRRRSPFTKCTRPRTAPTSASGCISTNTSHCSSPRFSSPMCLARSGPGNGALMGITLRCLSDSCQLDSGLNELSRVRSAARCHSEVLSQVWCPGRRHTDSRVAGRPSLGGGGGGAWGTGDGGNLPTGSREQGAGSRRCIGGDRSQLPAPCSLHALRSPYFPDVTGRTRHPSLQPRHDAAHPGQGR